MGVFNITPNHRQRLFLSTLKTALFLFAPENSRSLSSEPTSVCCQRLFYSLTDLLPFPHDKKLFFFLARQRMFLVFPQTLAAFYFFQTTAIFLSTHISKVFKFPLITMVSHFSIGNSCFNFSASLETIIWRNITCIYRFGFPTNNSCVLIFPNNGYFFISPQATAVFISLLIRLFYISPQITAAVHLSPNNGSFVFLPKH